MPLIRKYPVATQEEIDALKRLVHKVDRETSRPPVQPKPALSQGVICKDIRNPSADDRPALPPKARVFSEIGNAQITRRALDIDNPVQLLLLLMPELKPYKWQFEELMRSAGYLDTGHYKPEDKSVIDFERPYKAILAAANGSGKDMIIIAAFAVWFVLKRARNRVIITSSSWEQTKFQTEVHIRELVNRANAKFGPLFKYTQFHYVCPELGSEIKLFATDEAKRAEGYHPYGDGEMAIIINEAKSVEEGIFEALSRCTGYTHWIEVSSPGPRSGHMFRMLTDSVPYPNKAILGTFYFRRVTAYDCPHIPRSHIEAMKKDKGESSPWFRSSVLAEFCDYDEPVVVTEDNYDKCALNPPKEFGSDIGIGLDLAGGGDEDACFVRKGNKVIHSFFFRQPDTNLAAALIDKHLVPWKDADYYFRADNGGLGQAIIDKLVEIGWRVRRTNNQSPAFNKREFLNLGAEMYFYVKRLIERQEIIIPSAIEKLRLQLTTRRFRGFESTQGKFALEAKPEARAAGRPSPDRADAFVLCFASFKSRDAVASKPTVPAKTYWTPAQVNYLAQRGMLRAGSGPKPLGRFTSLTGKI